MNNNSANGRIRLLVMCGTLGVGGAQVQVAHLIPKLNREVFDVQVGYYNAKPDFPKNILEREGIPLKYFANERWSKRRFFCKVIPYFIKERFDMVHAWFASANHYGRLPAIIARVPVIIGGLRGERGFEGPWPFVYSLMNRFCSGWIVNSKKLKEIAERKMFFISRDSIKIVPNGIELYEGSQRCNQKHPVYDTLRSDRPVVGIIGRLYPVKNHLLFLKMIRLLLREGIFADFWIIGDGEMRKELEQKVSQYGLQKYVTFLGLRRDVDIALTRMDLVVLTSNSESCPNALLEAMNASLPIISTKCTSLEEIIEEGRNGFTVPRNDPEALAAKVKLILSNKNLSNEMGKHSRRIVEQRFSISSASRSLEDAYFYFLCQESTRHKYLRKKLSCLGIL